MFREKKGRYAAVNKPNTTSTNPFDEDYQEIELNTRPPALVSLRSLNPFDDEPQQPSPTPSTSSSAGLIEDGRSDSSYDERENRRKRFLGKLNKIENKLKKDDFNRAEVAFDPTDENGIVRYLVDKRVYGFPGTTGTILSNYRFYVCNNHPLLSICFLNKLNPFGRKERMLVFMNSLFFAIFVTFLVTETTFVPKISTCRLPCNKFVASNSSTIVCHGGYNDGLSYNEYTTACRYYDPWMLTALCGIVIVAYQSLLEFLGTCGCLQGKKSFKNNCCGTGIKGCVEWFGGTMLTVSTVVSTVFLVWAIIACYLLDVRYEILGNIILSKVWSMGEWFVWSAPYFAYRYPIDRRHFYRRLLRREKAGKHVSSSHDEATTSEV